MNTHPDINPGRPSAKPFLEPPRWDSVRAIYKKLSDELAILTRPYKVTIPNLNRHMMDHLIIGIDLLDSVLDRLESKNERFAISESVITFLNEPWTTWTYKKEYPDLADALLKIKSAVYHMEVKHQFLESVKIIFDRTERKRHSEDPDVLIELILEEGAATGALPISLTGLAPTHPFALFFKELCTLMGIADLLVDAREDYKSGLISIRPRLKLYLKLFCVLIRRGFKLLMKFPKKHAFIRYCLKLSWSLMWNK